MDKKDLYEGIGQLDEDLLARSEQKTRRTHRRWWTMSAAALLALVVIGGAVLYPGGTPVIPAVKAVCEAEYPKRVPYPDAEANNYEEAYEAWWEDNTSRRSEPGYADSLQPFFEASIRQFLGDAPGENRIYSPVNIYMALGMMAEITDGSSRQQILDLLGADSLEQLRSQAHTLWDLQYRRDGASTTLLASSLWMDEDVKYVQPTLETLARNYYASSYQGQMGSDELNTALQDWLNQQTEGLLEQQAGQIQLSQQTVLALATTISYQAKWLNEFLPSDTSAGVFHGAAGDVEAQFMHSRGTDQYYWGESFGAVARPMANNGGTMWLLLPDEGTSVEELLAQEETFAFLRSGARWENKEYLIVNQSVPRFDVSSQMDLRQGLQALGVTDVFSAESADFSPLTEEVDDLVLSRVQHDARIVVDEKGVTAAAYTVMDMATSGRPPEKEMDFVLDRPFLFAVVSGDGLPLFVGTVNQPA